MQIPGTHLWHVGVDISQHGNTFYYYYRIECDTSIRIMTWKVFKDTKSYKTEEFFSMQSDVHLEFASEDVEDVEDAYYSHCYYIVMSVIDGQEIRFMKEMDEMFRFSFYLTRETTKKIIQNMVHTMQEEGLMRRGNCMVFVSFLVQVYYPSLDLRATMSCEFANSILHQCAMVPKDCIPQIQGDFCNVYELLYFASEVDQPNLLSFFNCMYPLYDTEMCSKILSDHNRGTRSLCSIKSLQGDIEAAKKIVKVLVRRIVQPAKEVGNSREISFLEKLQRNLNIDLQIVMCETLISGGAHCLATSLEILYSSCERFMIENARKGDVLRVMENWEMMNGCSFISHDKIQNKVEKIILQCFEKASAAQLKMSYSKLKEVCLHGSLFYENETKIKLLMKFALSMSTDIHYLVAECLMQKKFQEIPDEDVDEIVYSWFENAYKHHCGCSHKRKKLPDFLTNLYTYYSEAEANPWLSTHTKLLEKLKQKTFEYLKEEDILDIIKSMPEIEKMMEGNSEDIFRAHIQALFQEGLENGDINKQVLFGQTKDCVVNSR
jgi:hypothetical protein